MPLYLYQCKCGETTEAFHKVAERHTHAPVCGKNETHGQMPIKLSPNIGYVQGDCHYTCPVTRQQVTTNRQRRNIMARHNLIDANDFPLTPKVVEKAEARKANNIKIGSETLSHDGSKASKPLLFQ